MCRKNKKKDKKKLLEQVSKIVETVENDAQRPQNEFELTKAEIAFKKQQEKMVMFKTFIMLLLCTIFHLFFK